MYGLDIGTSSIILAQHDKDKVVFQKQRDVFFKIRTNKFNKKLIESQLAKSNISYIPVTEEELLVIGNGAIEMASSRDGELRRPMRFGVVNPSEVENVRILGALIKSLTKDLPKKGKICYSVPENPINMDFDNVYHKSMCSGILSEQFTDVVPVNEAMGIVYAEAEDEEFTAVSCSLGAGMSNVCVSQYAEPILTFAIPGGGDRIDEGISKSLGISVAEACLVKENEGNLLNCDTREKKAIFSYYEEYITRLISLVDIKITNSKIKLTHPVSLYLAGGSTCIPGFKETFEQLFTKSAFGNIKITKIVIPENPLYTVAKGMLIASEV